MPHFLNELAGNSGHNVTSFSKAVFGSDIVKAEANIKKAASYKINLMTNNALGLAEQKDKDTVMETHFGQALMAFAKSGKKCSYQREVSFGLGSSSSAEKYSTRKESGCQLD